jgi:hypothetical protein
MQAVDDAEEPDDFWDLVSEHVTHEPDCPDYV